MDVLPSPKFTGPPNVQSQLAAAYGEQHELVEPEYMPRRGRRDLTRHLVVVLNCVKQAPERCRFRQIAQRRKGCDRSPARVGQHFGKA
jgi:hypothetical protein